MRSALIGAARRIRRHLFDCCKTLSATAGALTVEENSDGGRSFVHS
jgi:hypothetical protein